MFFNKFFRPSFFVLIVLAVVHHIATLMGIYDTTWWIDIIMHALGGVWVYLFLLWMAHTRQGRHLEPYVSIKNLLLFVLLVGVLWEIMEVVLMMVDYTKPEYITDTPLDLVMDVSGAFLTSLVYKK